MGEPGQRQDEVGLPPAFCFSLPASLEKVAGARAEIGEALRARGIDAGLCRDAAVVAHELIANAVRHGSRAGDVVQVSVEVLADRLRLRVSDAARGPGTPVALSPDEQRETGRGLRIVDQLASSWSARIVSGRQELYAELPRG
jgi:anti-sigma regulatory factor (Ser/Thr protein kinase)